MSVAKRSSVLLGLLLITLTAAINTNAQVFFSDFNSGVPGGASIPAGPAADPNEAKVDGGYLKLTDAVNGTGGIFYIDDFTGGPVTRFTATFKAAIFGSLCCGGGTLPADGFSFNLAPAASVVPNPAYGQPAEEGLNEGLAVNFDTWDNGGAEAPSIEVKWLGTVIGRTAIQPSQSPLGVTDPVAASKDVFINLDPDGKISVSYGGTVIFDHLQTPYDAATIGTPKWVMGARTGGANDNHWIDDLRIVTTSPALTLLTATGSTWSYQSNKVDPAYVPADAWTAPGFDDGAWPTGVGLFGLETTAATIAALPPFNTRIDAPSVGGAGVGPLSSYFRTHFNWSGATAGVTLNFTNYVDDGLIVYLNGVELFAFNVPETRPLPWDTLALPGGANPAPYVEGVPYVTNVVAGNLVAGDNVIAVVLHQQANTTSDDVFGMVLQASSPVPPHHHGPQPANESRRLRQPQHHSDSFRVRCASTGLSMVQGRRRHRSPRQPHRE